MRRLTIQLFVALLTFAVGTVAALLWRGVLSPSPRMASKSTILTTRELRMPPESPKFGDTISSRCDCSDSFTERELADDESAPKRSTSAWADERAISGGVLNGRAISLPKPAYPPIAKAARASGTVTVRILVDENGCIVNARAVGGHPLLQAAAVEAARQACFAPTRLSGEPVKVTGVVTYNFVIQ